MVQSSFQCTGESCDFWSVELFADLKGNGLFTELTDLAFLFSTDGISIFQSRSAFTTWPLILQSLNLPPKQRSKDENLFLLGAIPGPFAPVDLDSFLFPLIQEFKILQKGIIAWDGHRGIEFVLKAHITLIGADMPARERIMGVKGSGWYLPTFQT